MRTNKDKALEIASATLTAITWYGYSTSSPSETELLIGHVSRVTGLKRSKTMENIVAVTAYTNSNVKRLYGVHESGSGSDWHAEADRYING